MFYTVQCKFTDSKDKNVVLTSHGGTSGSVYDSIIDHNLDFLFCADSDYNLFLIPVADIIASGNKKSIALRTKPNKNQQGFNT